MRTFNKILSTLIAVSVTGLVFIFGQMPLMEGYNLFEPYIDTEFAEDYNPKLFDKITYDFTIDSVISTMGQPLFKTIDTITRDSGLIFTYTNDGFFNRSEKTKRFLIGDFAWYRSQIYFDKDGRITHIDKGWSYD